MPDSFVNAKILKIVSKITLAAHSIVRITSKDPAILFYFFDPASGIAASSFAEDTAKSPTTVCRRML